MDRTAAARQFKERARKSHVLKSGLPIEYRFVSIDMLTSRGVLPPGLLGGGSDEERQTVALHVAEDPTAITRLVDGVLAAGLTLPLVWSGDPDACPEDHILVSDLAQDRWEAFELLMAHSDMGASIVRSGAFRGGQPGVGGGDRPDGDPAGDVGPVGDADVAGGVGVRADGAGEGHGSEAHPVA